MNTLLREYKLFHNSDKWKVLLSEYAVLILNTPIKINPKHLEPIWNQAQFRICVDGGTNRWFNYANKHNLKLTKLYPEMVTGDFDSANKDHFKNLEKNNVQVITTPDQNHTDFTKALQELAKAPAKFNSVLVLVESSGGRLDHTFSNLNTLNQYKDIFKRDVDIFLVGRSSVTWLLQPGSHTIHIPEWIKQYPCGILPFAPKRSSIKTTGLKWNLVPEKIPKVKDSVKEKDGDSVEFGGLISSSNLFTEDSQVTVTTDTPLIWTMSIDDEDDDSSLTHKI